MTVFMFTCGACGPVQVIPMADIRTHKVSPPSHWCPHCGAPLSVSVDDDYQAPGSAA